MPDTEIEDFYVITAEPVHFDADGRPVRLRGGEDLPDFTRIPMEKFKSGMTVFMAAVRSLVGEIASKAGEYDVDQIEISASIGADGRVAFLGNGAGVDTSASFKVKLVRSGQK